MYNDSHDENKAKGGQQITLEKSHERESYNHIKRRLRRHEKIGAGHYLAC